MRITRGFTIIELIIVIVLVGFLSTIAAQMISSNFSAYFEGKTITNLTNKTNIAADNLMRELKSAQSVSAIATTGLTFVNQSGNTIVVALSGTNLTRSVNGATAEPLCDEVTSLTLSYFDQNFAATITPASVSFVTVNMTTTENGLPYKLIAGTVLRALLS